jgi:DNA-binding IclR family transcriptional regulator
LDKAFAVLDSLSNGGHSRSLTAVCSDTGLNKTTAFRLLHVMESKGYVTRTRGGYALGYQIYEIALNMKGSPLLRRLCRPHLVALQQRLNGIVHLGFPDQQRVICADKLESSCLFECRSHVGLGMSAHATALGKALLASLPEEEVQALYGTRVLPAETASTITDLPTLLGELRSVRARGVAVSNGEYQTDLQSWAVAVTDPRGRPVCAVSVSFPRGKHRHCPELVKDALVVCARSIREQMDRTHDIRCLNRDV